MLSSFMDIHNSILNRYPCSIKDLGINLSDSVRNSLCDSVFVIENIKLSGNYVKVFDIVNTSKDTVYLYSGLFLSGWIKQPYVHQYNPIDSSYVFSLTPLFKNFKKIFDNDIFLDVHYNWRKFVKLKPSQYYRVRFHIDETYFLKESNAIVSVLPHEPAKVLSSSRESLQKVKVKNASVRFGVFTSKSLEKLCSDVVYSMDIADKHKTNFFVIQSPCSFWGQKLHYDINKKPIEKEPDSQNPRYKKGNNRRYEAPIKVNIKDSLPTLNPFEKSDDW